MIFSQSTKAFLLWLRAELNGTINPTMTDLYEVEQNNRLFTVTRRDGKPGRAEITLLPGVGSRPIIDIEVDLASSFAVTLRGAAVQEWAVRNIVKMLLDKPEMCGQLV